MHGFLAQTASTIPGTSDILNQVDAAKGTGVATITAVGAAFLAIATAGLVASVGIKIVKKLRSRSTSVS